MGAVEIGAGHIYRERIGGAAPLFLGSLAEPERASIVLLGAPFDGTTSFVPGTRFGPARVREASIGLESYSPALDRTLEEAGLADVGDLELPFGNVSAALERIEGACRAVVAMGAKPFLVGGEHLVTLPAVRACHSRFKDLAVVQFDAHADLRDQYLGEHDSHATVMRRVAEVVGAKNLYQIGIRSGTRRGSLPSAGRFPRSSPKTWRRWRRRRRRAGRSTGVSHGGHRRGRPGFRPGGPVRRNREGAGPRNSWRRCGGCGTSMWWALTWSK